MASSLLRTRRCESYGVQQALLRRISVAAVHLQRSLCHAAAQLLATPVSPRPTLSSHRMQLFCPSAFAAEGLEARQWQRRRHKTNVELQQRSLLRFAQLAVTFIGRG